MEVFHFSQHQDEWNLSMDLSFTLFMGDSPLKPRTFWRYLGFYFMG